MGGPRRILGYGALSGIGQATCGTFAAANLPFALRAVIATPPSQRWSVTAGKLATKPPEGFERTVRRMSVWPGRDTVIRTG